MTNRKIELAKLPSQSVDMIFLDGDHSLDHVRAEFKECLRIVRRNGIISIHDYFSEGVKLWADYIKRFNSFETLVLNTSENRGLVVIKKTGAKMTLNYWTDLWFNLNRNKLVRRIINKFKSYTKQPDLHFGIIRTD